MRAQVGDRIHVHALNAEMIGEIVEVLGLEDSPAYRVKFPNGHEVVMTPTADTLIEPKQGE
ncbi:DUF1918 domain-containing protein [Nannocystis pusilla]|uniref:DUF1918 domain-containing protein n=1 Tax=Nannocystis pusilla TaxID=889268 RepID=UPI003B7CFA07